MTTSFSFPHHHHPIMLSLNPAFYSPGLKEIELEGKLMEWINPIII
jgi:hypothetical protein